MTSVPELRLGTRGSQLALWQANTVATRLAASGGPPCRLVIIKTSGDRLQNAPLSDVGGKRLFVKEIEDALLSHEIDLAVHSSKDMPAVLPDGLAIGGVLPREDPRDAVILPGPQPSGSLLRIEDVSRAFGKSPSIGTGSVRRIAQLLRLFPTARFAPIRGNLDTRLRKLDGGEYDALVLAAAGLRRLGFASRVSFALPFDVCVPSPGQGVVAIEVRANADAGREDADTEVRRVVRGISDEQAEAELAAERALVIALGGGCQTPIGAVAISTGPDRQELELVAIVAALDGSHITRATGRGTRRDANALGARVAEQLMAQGAGDILAEARAAESRTIADTARNSQP